MSKPLKLNTKLGGKKTDSEKEPVWKVNKPKTYPRSYRWRKADLLAIEELLEKTRGLSDLKVDVTKLLRGALHIASKQKPEKLINAILEAEKKSLISKIE